MYVLLLKKLKNNININVLSYYIKTIMVYYYENKYPAVDDVVIAKVINISEYGIEVNLIEYNNISGFINCSEVSRKKKVNFNKLLSIGKDILLHVIQVDKIKCLVDLSKRTIGDDDIKQFTEKHRTHLKLYNFFKQLYMKINNILLFEEINKDYLHEFMSQTLFKIQKIFENEYLLEKIIDKEENKEIIEKIDFISLSTINKNEFKIHLDEYIDKKINKFKPEIVETIKLLTYSLTGLNDIKYTLDFKTFVEYVDLEKDFEIKINYITTSCYSIIINQKNHDLQGKINILDAIKLLKNEIKKRSVEKNIQNQIVM